MIFSSVLFPQPEGPVISLNSPSPSVKETESGSLVVYLIMNIIQSQYVFLFLHYDAGSLHLFPSER